MFALNRGLGELGSARSCAWTRTACHISPMPQAGKHRGWYRPRSVPHFDTPERPQFITFRLADSLPREVAVTRAGEGSQDYRRRIESALDAGAGACWMARPELAEIVRDALMYGCGRTHDLYAYVVMPNHVHVLTVFRDGFRLADAVRDWKGFSARRINAILGREAWRHDSVGASASTPTSFGIDRPGRRPGGRRSTPSYRRPNSRSMSASFSSM